MAWTTPKTDWATGELVTADDLNAIGENLAALKQPATAIYTVAEDHNSTRSSYSDLNSNSNLTITTAGGDVLVHFDASVQLENGRAVWFAVDVDGTLLEDGRSLTMGKFYARDGGDARQSVSFTRLVQNLAAGSHTFKLQLKTAGKVRTYAGAQFWVREI